MALSVGTRSPSSRVALPRQVCAKPADAATADEAWQARRQLVKAIRGEAKACSVAALCGSSARAPQGPTARPLPSHLEPRHTPGSAHQRCGIARYGLARCGLLATLAGAVRSTQRTVQRRRTRRARDRPGGRLSRCAGGGDPGYYVNTALQSLCARAMLGFIHYI